MDNIKVSCIAPRLRDSKPEEVVELINQHNDADIVVLPEYFLEVCDFETPSVDKQIVIAGTKLVKSGSKTVNQIRIDGIELPQPGCKLTLTPWEKDLARGSDITFFEHHGVRCAVIVCFDVEFPEIAVELKKLDLDLLIVPSATEAEAGYLRISRCASSRSVELGCAVVTCHLIGECDNEMVDVNVGAHNMFLPAQSLFTEYDAGISKFETEGPVVKRFEVPIAKLRQQRQITDETNPAIYKY